MEPKQFFRLITKRLWLILILTVMASSVTYWYVKDSLKVYRSTAQLSTGIIESGISLTHRNTSPYVLESQFSNVISLLGSRNVLGLVSYGLFLHDIRAENPFREMAQLKTVYANTELKMAQDIIEVKLSNMQMLVSVDPKEKKCIDILKLMGYDYDALQNSLSVFRVSNTDYIRLAFESESPYLSAYVVNELCNEFVRYFLFVESQETTKSIEFFAGLVRQKKEELDKKAQALQEFKSANELVNPGVQGEAVVGRIAGLEHAREETRQKIAALAEANKKIEESIPGQYRTKFGQANQPESDAREIQNLKRKITDLNERYFAGGLKNNEQKDSLQMLRSQLHEKAGVSSFALPPAVEQLYVKKLNNEIELEMAKSNLNSINSELLQSKGQVPDFVSKEAHIAEMEREVNLARDAYLIALDKLNMAKNAFLANSGNMFKQIELGQPTGQAELSFQKAAIVPFAGMLVFVFCVFIILILAYLDNSINAPSQFEKLTHMPLLGVLNHLKNGPAGFGRLQQENYGKQEKEIQIYTDLLNNLRFEIESSQKKIFLVTSIRKGEGKSSIMAALAFKLNKAGKKVLLVDTNFKNNELTRFFSAEPLLEKMFKTGMTEPPVTKTEIPGIDIIGCAGGDYTPLEVFTRKQFEDFTKKMSERYDYLLLEGAPLNQFSDSKELLQCMDKVITVFSADAGLRQQDRAAIKYLNSLNGKVMGGVLNNVKNENLTQ